MHAPGSLVVVAVLHTVPRSRENASGRWESVDDGASAGADLQTPS